MKTTRTLSLKGSFIALFCLIAIGCNKDNLNQSQLIDQNVESEEMATHTQEAIQWFDSNIPILNNKAKSAGPNDKPHPMTLFSKKANWIKAFSYKKGNTIVTEGYLDWDNGMPVLINPSQHLGKGIGDLYDGDKRYLSPDIKLLIVDVNGNKHSEIMYLLPELNYLNSKANYSKRDNSYFEVDKKYSGDIYFYDLDGNYLRGHGFIDGKQNSFIGIQQASKPIGSFRTMSCNWVQVPVITWNQTSYYNPYYGFTVVATSVVSYTYNYVCTDTGSASSIPTYPGGGTTTSSGGGLNNISAEDQTWLKLNKTKITQGEYDWLLTNPWAINFFVDAYVRFSDRVNLGLVGNLVRLAAFDSGKLTSSFEQYLFENYWQGGGDIVLWQSIVYDILTDPNNRISQSPINTTFESREYSADIYNSRTFDYALGGYTYIEYFDGSQGIRDTYDFDWKTSTRGFYAECATRGVSIAALFARSPKGFKISYRGH